jgi:hypothetical protein
VANGESADGFAVPASLKSGAHMHVQASTPFPVVRACLCFVSCFPLGLFGRGGGASLAPVSLTASTHGTYVTGAPTLHAGTMSRWRLHT